MASFIYPTLNQLASVNLLRVPYVTGVMKLFQQQIALDLTLDAAALTAIECDFSGYAAITLAALNATYIDGVNGGVSFTIPTKQWNRSLGTPDVGNNVWGGWIETSAGDLLVAWEMASQYSMQDVGDALPLELTFNFYGTNEVYATIGGVPV
jgi:hypothetical protein